MDLQEEIEYYANEGICLWCNGTKEITHDAGKDTEWTEKCPVCNVREEEGDFSGASEGDR
jgi:hypothetical protein